MNLLLQSLLLSLASSNVTLDKHSSYVQVVNSTLNILKYCTNKSNDKNVLLAGEYKEILMNYRQFFDQVPVALVADSKYSFFDLYTLTKYSFFLYKKNFQSFVHILYKLRRFVVIASSQPILRLTLQRIQDTTWANYNGFHILIDRKTAERGCENAQSYLLAAWEFDLLKSIFLCFDPVEGVLIYSYDPYTTIAAKGWVEAERTTGRNGHPWLLLKRKYQNDTSLCDFLKLKRTSNLQGYHVRLNAMHMPPLLKIRLNETGLNKFGGDNGKIVKTIFRKLNATINIAIKSGVSLGGINKFGRMTGLMEEISNGLYDIGMNTRSFTMTWQLRCTYPHADAGICALSQASGEISELKKLLSFLITPFMIGMLTLCAISWLIMTKSEGFAKAFLNILRLIVCVSILRPPTISSYRIYLCMLLILSLTANAVFQSHWYSLLTVPVSYPNIDSFDDLKNSGYNIYATISFKDLLGDEELESRFHESSYWDCIDIVKNSTNAICISDCLHMQDRIMDQPDLHVSKYKIREFVYTFITRENWPLFDKFNQLLQKLVEAGLVALWKEQAVAYIFREFQLNMLKRRGFKILNLQHLDFSFYILGIGSACATIVFFIELIIHRHRSNIKKVTKKRCFSKFNETNCLKEIKVVRLKVCRNVKLHQCPKSRKILLVHVKKAFLICNKNLYTTQHNSLKSYYWIFTSFGLCSMAFRIFTPKMKWNPKIGSMTMSLDHWIVMPHLRTDDKL